MPELVRIAPALLDDIQPFQAGLKDFIDLSFIQIDIHAPSIVIDVLTCVLNVFAVRVIESGIVDLIQIHDRLVGVWPAFAGRWLMITWRLS